jgi:hypothetical protein
MNITRDNYEIYFLDYLEGNLDEELVNEFIEFLQVNPDLKDELQIAGQVSLEADEVYFRNKEKLYKEEYDREELFIDTSIALLEGDLNDSEKARFISFLKKHPQKQEEAALFEWTKQVPDQNIVFNKKSRLYKRPPQKTIMLWASRAAAVLALAFFMYKIAIYRNPENSGSEPRLAVVEHSENNRENRESSALPAKTEGIQEPVQVKEEPENVVRSRKPEILPHKTDTKRDIGLKDQEMIAEARVPDEIPQRMNSRNINLAPEESPQLHLVSVNNVLPESIDLVDEERLLGQVIKEKTGMGNLTLNKVAQAGLNLVTSLSRDKFNYETNSEGQITELSFDSRLLAFSIPIGNE